MLDNTKNGFSIKISYIWIFALTVFFSVCMNYDWRTGYIAWYGSLALLAASYFYAFKGKMLFKNLSFLSWFVSFAVLGALSVLWSLSSSVVMDIVKTFIIYSVVILLIQFSLNYDFSIDSILRGYLLATLINALYIALTVDITQLGETQLGTQMLEGWNGNGIGFMMSQGAFIAWYLFKRTDRRIAKVYYFLSVVALSFMTVYTGSRTAFIVLVAEFLLYFWLSHPTRMIRNALISVVSIALIVYLVMNVESFYNVLGSRFEGLFALFGGEGKVDSSADIRDVFIENGKRWFAEKPILGYGLNNYKVLNSGATGRFTYAHNNFIELAVDLGVVGLIWYYSVYAYLIVKLLKNFKNDLVNVFLLSALIVSVMSHYGTIAYYDFYQNLLLLLCFFAVNKAKKERTVTHL